VTSVKVNRKSFVVELFSQQRGRLMRYLTARVRSAADAQDIAQETYLRLLRLERVDLVRDPQAYLFRVAANLAREHDLDRARARLGPVEANQTLWSDADAIEVAVDRDALVARMQRALGALQPHHRAVLILHRRDGMTYEEIARELGISFHTVKKYLSVALASCREVLLTSDQEEVG